MFGRKNVSVASNAQTPGATGEDAVATGVSKGGPSGWSFEEAFNDAIAQLGSAGPNIPDWLDTYTVEEIGARIGGIAGFNDLLVTVKRAAGPGLRQP